MDDVFVYLIDMPGRVREMVCPCVGGYTVYINARLSSRAQEQAYRHALRHIEGNDFEKHDVQSIEQEAHA